MIKIILILAVVFFVFGRLLKYILKYALIGFVNSAQTNQNKTYSQQRPTGDIKVENNQNSGNKKSNTSGDYIDYEVIK